MAYVQGFVAAVPAGNKESYRKHAADAAKLFREFGATRIVEAWGEDVPDGKLTDFKRAVQAKPAKSSCSAGRNFPTKPSPTPRSTR